ncbi:glycoside hydrolase family 130 protein [uncultured Victivallis sp.]|uniref:glycoside hydrolase family 130 protein n=1 Tax=uncultured Victivallis sp. TaxID=354118 RepID=UPI0025986BF3|nr:glycoside hydrolase family 130 protein [uncultured Victivallis sp.]
MKSMKFKSMLIRSEHNPLFDPADFPFCAADQVFNPGQVRLPDGRTILLLSVMPRNERSARCHVAESTDGIHFTIHPEPIFKVDENKTFGKLDSHPIDCRITYFPEDNCCYIMRPGNSSWGCCAFLYRTTDFRTVEPVEIIALPHNRVPCLFPEKINGEYVRIDRPYSVGAPYEKSFAHMWISRSPDLIHWGRHRPLLQRDFMPWNNLKIGPTVPIRTEKGWLEIIHGVQNTFVGWRYSLGALLLDLENPEIILGRMNRYLLTPETPYERQGVIPEVVFATGAIADLESREFRVYYGGADTTVNLATGNLDEIIDGCLKGI